MFRVRRVAPTGGVARTKRRTALSALTTLALVACGTPEGEDTFTEESSLRGTAVPQLGCFTPLPSQGECARAADCPTGERCVQDRTLPPLDRGPVALACGEPLGASEAGESCERAEDCQSGLCGLVGSCFEPCVASEDCREGEHCRPLEVRVSRDALAPVMACARSIALPSDVRLSVVPGGSELRKGLNALRVPGTQAPSLVYVQAACGEQLQLLTVRSNDLGRDLYDRAAPRDGTPAENPVLHDGSSLAALLFPNNPVLMATAGGLTIGVRVDQPAHADVVLASRAQGPRLLDLNVFYVGGGASSVPGGYRPGEPRVAKMLAKLDRKYRSIGLSLGLIHEYDVRGALREELSVLEVPRRKVGEREVEGRPLRLNELFRLSAGASTSAINVFLVSDMGSYLGIAGGIPGLLGVHGGDRSGVAIAADVLGDLSDADQVLMHELGHFMGLFHTTESSGLVIEPLADTPACTLERDEDENAELSTWECEGFGDDNLMFWSGAGEVLTPQQIQVLASSVVLR
jgi:hypothetical protein